MNNAFAEGFVQWSFGTANVRFGLCLYDRPFWIYTHQWTATSSHSAGDETESAPKLSAVSHCSGDIASFSVGGLGFSTCVLSADLSNKSIGRLSYSCSSPPTLSDTVAPVGRCTRPLQLGVFIWSLVWDDLVLNRLENESNGSGNQTLKHFGIGKLKTVN